MVVRVPSENWTTSNSRQTRLHDAFLLLCLTKLEGSCVRKEPQSEPFRNLVGNFDRLMAVIFKFAGRVIQFQKSPHLCLKGLPGIFIP